MAKVLIVGAGAAGLMAAGAAVRQGHQVTVLEHMDKPAQKILVTGKGRCNVTNDCTAEEFLRHVRTNPRFLFSSLGAFPPARTMELFESLGVELKVERGRRCSRCRTRPRRSGRPCCGMHRTPSLCTMVPESCCWKSCCRKRRKPPLCRKNPRHPKKKKGRPGPALHRRAGHFGPGIPGRCRTGGHRRRELPHHRFHR